MLGSPSVLRFPRDHKAKNTHTHTHKSTHTHSHTHTFTHSQLLYFEHPYLAPHSKERAQIRCSNKATLVQIRFLSICLQLGLAPLGTPGDSLCAPKLGNPGSLCGWALQGVLALGLGTPASLLGTPGSLWVGGQHIRETLGLGFGVGHSRNSGGWALQESRSLCVGHAGRL